VQEYRSVGSATRSGVIDAVARAAGEGAPTIATAALATATGFLVLLLSPVPMVRGFGVLLVVGIAIALVVALTAGSAALVVTDRNGGFVGASMRGAAEILRGAGAKLASLRPRRKASSQRVDRAPGSRGSAVGRILAGSVRRPHRILAAGLVLAAVGWVADTQTSVQTDVTKLVPSNMPALRDLHTLENVTGVSGEIDVTVHARNVATPTVIGWMIRYENSLLTHFGYLEAKGCGKATLCPALSLPDLFSTGSQGTTQAPPSTADINTLLKAVPGYFSQAVITPDHREAALAFGIRLMPLARQQKVIDYMRSQLHPPAGVSAQLAGIPVLAAEANAALSSSARRLLTLLAGLVAVGLVLLVVFKCPRRVVVPLIPIALATGWSALILYLIGIPLNPMSATLGTLVIAISTEFSVLLSERFRQERQAGYELSDALARTYRSTGRAVLASGITAIAGFGVLIFSNITMLRDFGFVTLIDLSVSLIGVLLLLPAVLALSERGDLPEAARGSVRRAIAAVPRPGRRARVA
jgi:hydrophobe/amphiphile efflux-3 (HAE3) family protein